MIMKLLGEMLVCQTVPLHRARERMRADLTFMLLYREGIQHDAKLIFVLAHYLIGTEADHSRHHFGSP